MTETRQAQDKHAETLAEARERIVRLETQLLAITATLAAMSTKLDAMAEVVSNARFGTKFVIGMFGLAASAGASVSWLIAHVKWSS